MPQIASFLIEPLQLYNSGLRRLYIMHLSERANKKLSKNRNFLRKCCRPSPGTKIFFGNIPEFTVIGVQFTSCNQG